jgi:hypothetical protein
MEKELGAWQPKMHKCSTCETEIHISRCPDCGGNPLPSEGQPRKALNNYSLLLAPGLLVGLLAYIVFPPLDAGPLVALGLCTFFLPLVMQLLSIVRKRLSEDLGRLRTIYVYSSLALLLLALLPLLNGWLDGSPPSAVEATVIQKTAVLNRSTTSYRLTVSSWRLGRSVEELRVGARTYDNVFVGNTITVAVHKGFFGLPWDGAVSSK